MCMSKNLANLLSRSVLKMLVNLQPLPILKMDLMRVTYSLLHNKSPDLNTTKGKPPAAVNTQDGFDAGQSSVAIDTQDEFNAGDFGID